jgi:excinuclease ABC subunit C
VKKIEEILELITDTAAKAGTFPGVYEMIDGNGEIIYVGKANNLRNRLQSYANLGNLSKRIRLMVANISTIKFTVVNSEVEALLLESNLIKKLKPMYNILLKDDKTFPYIVIDWDHDFPRIFKHRTLKPGGSNFFGPYPGIHALDDTLNVIQKIFLLRTCTNNVFTNTKRPCLQHFLKRCSAPCVGKITKEDYTENVKLAKNLLLGKDEIARKALVNQMYAAAKSKDFELAAVVRDRVSAITEIQAKQYIRIDDVCSADFVAFVRGHGIAIACISFFRSGKSVGTETFLIENIYEENTDTDIMASFVTQIYMDVIPPARIITDCDIGNVDAINGFFSALGVTTKIVRARHELHKRVLKSCYLNAKLRLNGLNLRGDPLPELCKLVGRDNLNRIEVFDNSHIQGKSACGVMIVYENGEIQRKLARYFNISDEIARGGDDIWMMKFLIEKRLKSDRINKKPDLIVVDGGKTQVAAARDVVCDSGLSDTITVIGIAKQNDRKVGDEKVVLSDGEEKTLAENNPLLNFLITLRDAAHRAAIAFHRKRRQKAISASSINDIPFIGHSRKKALLEHFGTMEALKMASMDDLKMVKGIGAHIAKSIVQFLNRAQE